MGIINPVAIAEIEHKNSTRLTSLLTKQIIDQDSSGVMDRNAIRKIKKQISQEREKNQRQELEKIQNSGHLKDTQRRKLEMSLKKGASDC